MTSFQTRISTFRVLYKGVAHDHVITNMPAVSIILPKQKILKTTLFSVYPVSTSLTSWQVRSRGHETRIWPKAAQTLDLSEQRSQNI